MIKGDKMNIEEFLTLAAEKEASDLFIKWQLTAILINY